MFNCASERDKDKHKAVELNIHQFMLAVGLKMERSFGRSSSFGGDWGHKSSGSTLNVRMKLTFVWGEGKMHFNLDIETFGPGT